VDSTNEQALLAVAAGTARHGDVHLADEQTAGRGRLGRTWASPAGAGLYASLVLMPAAPAPPPETLTAAAGLAIVGAVTELGVQGAQLRWPNDVLVAGAKLAGILVETRGLDPAAPHFVLGIGLNLLQRELPAEFLRGRIVTNLELLRGVAPREEVLGCLLKHLDRRLDQAREDAAALARDFVACAGLADAPVCIQYGITTATGILRELNWEEGLLLEDASGESQRIPLPFVHAVDPLG
jgi:BirA family biotin operon repressor/biotin-[acetyl-CoA-carboxylase] ligase